MSKETLATIWTLEASYLGFWLKRVARVTIHDLFFGY